MAIVDISIGTALAAIGASLAITAGAFATSFAQSAIGSAGLGMMAEKPENFGNALLFLVLPETILIFGFVVAVLILLGAGFI